MISRSTKDSSFRYGHFTISCLDIFDQNPFLEPFESSHVQVVNLRASLDDGSIEFEFETDRSIYLLMIDIHIQTKVELQKAGLFEDFGKKLAWKIRYAHLFHR